MNGAGKGRHDGGTTPTRRSLNGQLLDVAAAAVLLGCTEKGLRARVDRQVVPFRRLGGRIVFLRSELQAFLMALPGCSLEEAVANIRARHGEAG